ncbi:MAG TPA: proton-conducting transporter membrane subunit [Bacteroidales bacterium]|nr:proton-conducting transporter membrane subunit [Bacteroidales bacterium]
MSILTLFILLPLLTIMGILVVRKPDNIRALARTGTGLQLLLSFILIPLYLSGIKNDASDNMLFVENLMWFGSLNIHFVTGADGITIVMLVLGSLAAFAAVFLTQDGDNKPREYYVTLLLTVSASSGFIVSIDMVTGFMFFAGILVPFFILQSIKAKENEIASSMKFILIPAGGAALLLVGLLGVYMNSAPDGNYLTFNITDIQKYLMNRAPQKVFFTMVFTGFAVIGGMAPFSIWLPGSISSLSPELRSYYSGIIIKLGIYGAFRFGINLMPEGAQDVSLFFLLLAATGTVLGSVLTIFEKDLRKILIWSSLSFSGLIFFALLLLNKEALTGAILMMFSHGTAVILLFAIAGMKNSQSHTTEARSIFRSRKHLLVLSVVFFVAVLILGGIPGSVGFIGWRSLISAFLNVNEPIRKIAAYVVLLSMALVIVFILIVALRMLLSSAGTAELNKKERGKYRVKFSEKMAIVILFLPPLAAGMFPSWILSLINTGLRPLLERIGTINPL